MNPEQQEIITNLERLNENIAALKLAQDRDDRVLYGDKDIRLVGLLERTEAIEAAVKSINGMPEQFEKLQVDVRSIIETDQKRRWMIRGMVVGVALQGGGVVAILVKVFS